MYENVHTAHLYPFPWIVQIFPTVQGTGTTCKTYEYGQILLNLKVTWRIRYGFYDTYFFIFVVCCWQEAQSQSKQQDDQKEKATQVD